MLSFCQIYIYQKRSMLPLVRKLVGELFESSSQGIDLAAASSSGSWKTRRSVEVQQGIELLTQRTASGFNRVEAGGKIGGLKAHMSCTLTPLNEDWSPIGEMDISKRSPSDRRMLWTFQSREDYLKVNRISRDYVLLEIVFSDVREKKKLVEVFKARWKSIVEVVSLNQKKNYIGFIDRERLMTAATSIGGNPSLSKKIDTHFDRPHAVIFGPTSVMDRYLASIRKQAEALTVEQVRLASATALVFEDRERLCELESTWHELAA